MTPIRVMHVVLSLEPGGTERLVIELCERLRAETQPSVCCLDAPGVWANELTGAGVPLVALDRKPGFHPGLGPAIRRTAAAQGAGVLHCHQYSPFVYGSLAAWRHPELRVVYTEHGRVTDEPTPLRRRIANRVLGRRPDVITAVSHELRQHMVDDGFAPSRVAVVHNGIEPGPPVGLDDERSARAALGVDPSAFVVGSVARFDPVKRLDVLVRAFARVARRDPSATLVLIGDGPDRPRVDAVIAEERIGDRVVLTGMRPGALSLMPAFDVYANTSATEGISLTLLEAMAASRPIVASRVGGTPEVIVDGVTGWLVPAGGTDATADALERARADESGRRAAGLAGRERVVSQFSVERMTRAYLSAYTGGGVI